jgi:hypothetical protein
MDSTSTLMQFPLINTYGSTAALEGSDVVGQTGAFIAQDGLERLPAFRPEGDLIVQDLVRIQNVDDVSYILILKFFHCLQFKEINARFEKIEPVRSMFDSKQHSSSVQCITPPNRFSAPPSQNKSVTQQAVTNQQWPGSELKVSVSGGSTRGNSPKSKSGSEGSMSPLLSSF